MLNSNFFGLIYLQIVFQVTHFIKLHDLVDDAFNPFKRKSIKKFDWVYGHTVNCPDCINGEREEYRFEELTSICERFQGCLQQIVKKTSRLFPSRGK